MSEEFSEERAQNVLELSFERVTEILNRMGNDGPCANCRTAIWALSSYEGRPNVVNLPIVNAKGMAHWAFYLTCRTCGAARFVDAAHVAIEAEKDTKSE